jgi:hypothetical protein
MHGGAPALALNERTLLGKLCPPHPVFHRAPADDVMLDRLTHAAQSLGSTLPYDANLEDALRPSYGNVQLYGR